jgi:hypothetical protein
MNIDSMSEYEKTNYGKIFTLCPAFTVAFTISSKILIEISCVKNMMTQILAKAVIA